MKNNYFIPLYASLELLYTLFLIHNISIVPEPLQEIKTIIPSIRWLRTHSRSEEQAPFELIVLVAIVSVQADTSKV